MHVRTDIGSSDLFFRWYTYDDHDRYIWSVAMFACRYRFVYVELWLGSLILDAKTCCFLSELYVHKPWSFRQTRCDCCLLLLICVTSKSPKFTRFEAPKVIWFEFWEKVLPSLKLTAKAPENRPFAPKGTPPPIPLQNRMGWPLYKTIFLYRKCFVKFLFKATTSMAYDFVRGTFLTATNSIQGQVCDSVGFFWDFNFDSVQNP